VIRATEGQVGELPVTWASRTEQPDGKSSPEELAAAAHSSCFAMALALRLGERKVIPRRLTVTAAVTLDEAGGVPTIVSSDIQVRARVPGLDDGVLQAAVAEAAALCPGSRLFAGAKISVNAAAEPAS
jgi:lipoyl-dependent peroxiredoxin